MSDSNIVLAAIGRDILYELKDLKIGDTVWVLIGYQFFRRKVLTVTTHDGLTFFAYQMNDIDKLGSKVFYPANFDKMEVLPITLGGQSFANTLDFYQNASRTLKLKMVFCLE